MCDPGQTAMPDRASADDDFLPPSRSKASSSGGSMTVLWLLLLLVVAVGVYIWHVNRQDQLKRLEEERLAEREKERQERVRECNLYVAGSTKERWKHYDLSESRAQMPRATCDDNGDVVCPIGFSGPPCDDHDCAPGYSGAGCDVASCEIQLATHGGHGKCLGDQIVCDANAFGPYCENVCSGSAVPSPEGCVCPSEYLFEDRGACSGACSHATVGGANCDECADGFASRGNDPTRPLSTGCEVDLSMRDARVGLINKFGIRTRVEACELETCRNVAQLQHRLGVSFLDGISAVEVPKGFKVEVYKEENCKGVRRAEVRCDERTSCADKAVRNFNSVENRNASIRATALDPDSCRVW